MKTEEHIEEEIRQLQEYYAKEYKKWHKKLNKITEKRAQLECEFRLITKRYTYCVQL